MYIGGIYDNRCFFSFQVTVHGIYFWSTRAALIFNDPASLHLWLPPIATASLSSSSSQQKRREKMEEATIHLKSFVSKITHITSSPILLMRSSHVDSLNYKKAQKVFSHDPTTREGEDGLGGGLVISPTGCQDNRTLMSSEGNCSNCKC